MGTRSWSCAYDKGCNLELNEDPDYCTPNEPHDHIDCGWYELVNEQQIKDAINKYCTEMDALRKRIAEVEKERDSVKQIWRKQ
jgi:hypothetical protein